MSKLKMTLAVAALVSLSQLPSNAAGNNHGSLSPTACTQNATPGSRAGVSKLGGRTGSKKFLELKVFGESSNAAAEVLGIPLNPLATFSFDCYNLVNPAAGPSDDSDLQLVVLDANNNIAKLSISDSADGTITPLGHNWFRVTAKPQSIINEFEGITVNRLFVNCDGPNGNTGTLNDFLISNVTVNGVSVPNAVFTNLTHNTGSCIYLENE